MHPLHVAESIAGSRHSPAQAAESLQGEGWEGHSKSEEPQDLAFVSAETP